MTRDKRGPKERVQHKPNKKPKNDTRDQCFNVNPRSILMILKDILLERQPDAEQVTYTKMLKHVMCLKQRAFLITQGNEVFREDPPRLIPT